MGAAARVGIVTDAIQRIACRVTERPLPRQRWRRALLGLVAALLLAVLLSVAPAVAAEQAKPVDSTAGQLLVANRQMTDPRFAKTIIYMVAHDGDGAFGLVVNRRYGEGSLRALLDAFDIPAPPNVGSVPLLYGGPVQPERGFVLHSPDYDGDSTMRLKDWLALSTGRDVLEAMAGGNGPKQAVVLLGYAGWGPSQLDGEIAHSDWLLAPAEPSLIFEDDPDNAWERAMQQAGIPL